jgi:hypothetical protein
MHMDILGIIMSLGIEDRLIALSYRPCEPCGRAWLAKGSLSVRLIPGATQQADVVMCLPTIQAIFCTPEGDSDTLILFISCPSVYINSAFEILP